MQTLLFMPLLWPTMQHSINQAAWNGHCLRDMCTYILIYGSVFLRFYSHLFISPQMTTGLLFICCDVQCCLSIIFMTSVLLGSDAKHTQSTVFQPFVFLCRLWRWMSLSTFNYGWMGNNSKVIDSSSSSWSSPSHFISLTAQVVTMASFLRLHPFYRIYLPK